MFAEHRPLRSLVRSPILSISFCGLMIVSAARFIPLSPLSIWLSGKATSGLERMFFGVLVKRQLQGSIDRCTSRRNRTEKKKKKVEAALNTKQLSNQTNFKAFVCDKYFHFLNFFFFLNNES